MQTRWTSLSAGVAGIWIVLSLGAAAATPDVVWHALAWNGMGRVYGVYEPDGAKVPAPLVVLLHGGGGSAADTWQQEHGRSWRTLSDAHGFVLVLPEGCEDPGDPASHHWNDCRTDVEREDFASNQDDVGFILAVVEAVARGTAIDLDRVFVTGASNGGMMTYRLAFQAGDRFAAAAAVIANLPDPTECHADKGPIPMLIMNGTDDPLMPYEGGCVAGERCERGRVMSTADTVASWVALNGASPDPTIERLPNRSWLDGSTVSVYRYDGRPGGADVVYYHVEGGGHTYPGSEGQSFARRIVAGRKNRDIDGPTEIWAFFESHS